MAATKAEKKELAQVLRWYVENHTGELADTAAELLDAYSAGDCFGGWIHEARDVAAKAVAD